MYIKWNFIICFAHHYFHPLPQHSWGYLSFSFTFCLYLLSCLRSPGYRLIYRSRNSWRKSLCNQVPRKILRASSAQLPFPTYRSWVGTRALLPSIIDEADPVPWRSLLEISAAAGSRGQRWVLFLSQVSAVSSSLFLLLCSSGPIFWGSLRPPGNDAGMP